MLLVILQNTYEYLTDTTEWEAALWRSHTGRRLSEMIPDNIPFTVTNATCEIGHDASSVCAPDGDHIAEVIRDVRPTVILACGKVAQRALADLGIEYMPAPHPAWRRLSKGMTAEINASLRRSVVDQLTFNPQTRVRFSAQAYSIGR